MKKSYLNSGRNTAVLFKPSRAFRLLWMVLFVCLYANVVSAQGTTCGTATAIAIGGCANSDNISDTTQNLPNISGCSAGTFRREGWYTFTVTGGPLNVTITGIASNRNLFLQLISSTSACTGLSQIACANSINNDSAQTETISVTLNNGIYYVKVVNVGTTNNDMALTSLCVTVDNDVCTGAIPLTSNTLCTPTTGSTIGATDNNETGDCTNGTERAMWYQFTAVSTTQVVTVDGIAGFDAVIGAISACGTTTTPTGGACVDATSGGGVETMTLTGLTIGSVYKIQVYDYAGDRTANGFTICITHSPPAISSFTPNNGCANATPVTITGTNFTGATAVRFGGTNAASFTVDSATQITATPATGTTGTISVTTPGGTDTSVGSFTVTPTNTFGAASSTPTVCIGSALPAAITHTTTGATGIGTPTGLPAGVTATWASNTITINGTPTAPGTYNYSIPLAGGCGSVSATGTITVSGQPTAAAGGTQTICSNGTATVSGATSSNGTIAWTENGAGSITSGATTLTPIYTAAAGDAGNTVTLTMTVSNSPCTAATATYSVVVLANNTVSAASSSPNLCISTLMADITHTTTGATGIGLASGLPTGVTASWASNTITISGTPTAFGTFNYSIPLTGGCGSLNATGTIIVNPNNTVGAASASPTLCVNTALATAITHTTTGATGIGTPTNLPAGVSASWTSNTITISGTPSVSGVFSYSIPLTGGCGTVLYATGTITVEDPVAAAGTIIGTATVCQGQNGVIYSVPTIANATAYSWTLPTGATIASGANTNSITVNFAANASSGNIGVYGNNTCGNGVSATFPVTVNTISTAPTGISGITTICNGDSTTLTVTGGVIGIGATAEWFTGSCGGISAGTGNSITVSPTATTTYYVRYSGTCNTTTCTSVTVTVNTLSVAPSSITGISTICESTTTTLSISGGSAGTAAVAQWFTGSCGGTSAGIGNSITVSPIVTTTYYVRYSGTCNTTACASVTVTVNPLPIAAGSISGTPTVCQGQNGVAYSVPAITNATSYTWTLPTGATIITGANSNSITVDYATTATSGNVTVIGTNSCGGGAIATFAVVVNPLPAAAGTITGLATVCQGQNGVVYSIPAIANATGYNWTLPTGASITAGTNTNAITVNYSTTAISGNITVQGTNSCGDGVISANYPIIVNPLPIAAGTITGNTTVCQGQNGVVYSVPAIANATGYTWTLPTGVTITSGTNTNSIIVNYSVTATSGDITVLGTNGCGNGIVSANYPVTVNPLPAAAGTISGTVVVCQGQTNIIYSVPAIANATNYIWTLPTGATIASGSGTNTIYVNYSMTAVSGNITVKGNNACGDGVISANYPVTVNITPKITDNFSTTACSGLPATVTPTNGGGNIVPLGTTYSWGLPSVTGGITGATALSGQTSFNQTLTNPTNTAQTASYNVTATTGGCSATTFSVLVTVNPKPVVLGTPSTQPICSGGAITPIVFSETSGILGSINYNWTRIDATSITGIAASGSGTITGNLTNTTNSPLTAIFRVIATTQNGCDSLPFDVNVVVNPTPTVLVLPASQPICSGNPITAIVLSNPNGVPGPITYSWTRDNTTNITGIAASGSGASIAGSLTNTTNTVQTTTFTIKATANSCDSATTTVTVTVNPRPTVAVSTATQTICGNDAISPITITNPNNVVGTTFSWSRDKLVEVPANPGMIAASGTGNISGNLFNNTNSNQVVTFTITATAAGCASTTTTSTITVKPTPTIAISNSSQTICSATAIANMAISNPNNVAGTTYTWSRDNTALVTGIANSGSSSGPFSISGTLANSNGGTQTTTFTIIATANGCSSTSTSTVTVYAPLVVPVIGNSQDVCNTQTPAAFYMSTPVTGGSGSYTYQWQRSAVNANLWSNAPGTSTNSTYIGSGSTEYDYQLIVTDSYCSTKKVTSNKVNINILGIGGILDQPTITNAPALPVCNGTISPAIGVNIGHSALSDVDFNWYFNNGYIVSTPTAGPVDGTTTTTGFLARNTRYTFNFTAANTTNATQTTILTVVPSFANGFGTCSSDAATISIQVRPTPTATATVPNAVICNSTSAFIAVKGNITDATTTLSWVRSDANSNVSSTAASGSNTPVTFGGTYIIPDILSHNEVTAQTVIYTITPTSNGCPGTSITVTIVVAPSINAGTVGAVQTICSGDTPAAFTQTGAPSGGSSYGYQWYSSTTSATGPWAIIGGATATGYSAPALTQNTWYQRVVTANVSTTPSPSTGVTYTATSNSCTANNTAIAVTINNINPGTIAGTQAVCNGSIPIGFTNVTLATGGNTPTYQWQVSTNGADCITDFTDIPGATGVGYTPAAGLTVTTYYRRKETSTLSGKACVAYSNCITVTINNVTAGTVGSDQTICGNNPDAFTVIVAATGSGVLSYQWQSNTTGCGGSWGNITVNGTSATYDPPPGLSATTYYRRITTSTLNGVSCSVNGNCITVTANSVTAGAISGNRTICSGGDPDAFTETTPATGTGITYQWQYSLVGGGGPWTDVSGATSATYDAPGPINQNTYYRREVKASVNGYDCYDYSSFVVVFVNNVTASVVAGDQTLCSTVDPAAFTVVTPATGTVAPTYQWQSSTTGCSGWSPIPGATSATYDPPPTNAQTTYFQVVVTSTLNGESCSAASNCITVISLSKSWNGSISTNWNMPTNWSPAGIPDATNCVIIPNTTNKPIISGTNYNAFAYSLTVLNGGSLVVNSTNSLKVIDLVNVNNGGSLTFEDKSSLVQINNVANSGNMTYKRETTIVTKFDYTYWSTPVLPFTLGGVSPTTLGDKFYSFDSSVAPDGDWQQESAATPMNPGVGYIIRGPQENWAPNPPATAKASFVGVPNNGHYEITGIIPDRSYLLGNPYPSALDADSFLVANKDVLNGTLYFWTHNTPIAIGTPDPGSGLYAYSGNDYAAYNATGGVGAAPPDINPVTSLPYPGQAPSSIPGINNDNIPSGKIASGQGFFGSSKVTPTGSTIVYNNNMRVGVGAITGDNTQFFKTKDSKTKTATQLEKHRIWLNLTNIQGAFKQTLVGYVTDATNAYEDRFDGESYDGNDFLDFYSVNQDKNLTIQGRALPFDENDEVLLGYRIAVEGTFTIKIDQTDGLLANQPVFIEDKLTNTVFDLKGGNYTFNTLAGTFDDRFVLRYTNKTLGTNDLVTQSNQVLISVKNKEIKINSFSETIDKVTIYDVLGRQIYQNGNVNSNEILITNLVSSHQTLIVKTSLQNGKTVTDKIIY